jgi:hypothetical protein
VPYLLGAALVVIAILLLQRRSAPTPSVRPPSPAAVPTEAASSSASVPAAPTAAPAAAPTEEAAAVPTALPTAGPSEAASASVGVPRGGAPAARPSPRRAPTAPPVEEVVAAAPPAPAAPPPARASSKPDRIDATYTTRKGVRFTSSPEQARLYVDGRYVGIADDWDNRGGGRAYEFDGGTHYVRLELPGYQTKQLEIDVRADAGDSISIDEELERYSRAPFEKLPAVADRTTGPVELHIDPPDASVSEEGRYVGPASSFGPGSPMQLKGPAVHDLVVSAAGYKPKMIRILVAPNAGKDVARIVEKLKKE